MLEIKKIKPAQARKLYTKQPMVRRRKENKYTYDSIVIASDADVDRLRPAKVN